MYIAHPPVYVEVQMIPVLIGLDSDRPSFNYAHHGTTNPAKSAGMLNYHISPSWSENILRCI